MFRYGKAKLREGFTRIKDGIVNEFLIEGSDKAVLFDTGLDLFNIRDYVGKLTDKELIVVNSHFHPDHANGNHHFEKVWIGEADLPTCTTDNVYFKLVDDIVTAMFRQYPKTRKLQPWIDRFIMTKQGDTQYLPLKDGDEIDLGRKKLIVKSFPGHTPGSITLLDPALKFIYAGHARYFIHPRLCRVDRPTDARKGVDAFSNARRQKSALYRCFAEREAYPVYVRLLGASVRKNIRHHFER